MAASAASVVSLPPSSRNFNPSIGSAISHMFSMTPRTLSFVLTQKDSSFRTSINDTSWGVETTRAPS